MKDKIVVRAIGLIALFLSTLVVASESPSMLMEGGTQALIFDVKSVALEVSDQVEGGCMPRPNSIRASAEAALRRNGLSVIGDEQTLLTPVAKVSALGYAHSDYLCVVAFTFSISKFIGANVPYSNNLDESMRSTLAPIEIDIYSTILSGGKSDMQDRLEREAEKGANDLFIAVERSKDYVKSKWPALWQAAYQNTK